MPISIGQSGIREAEANGDVDARQVLVDSFYLLRIATFADASGCPRVAPSAFAII